MRRIFYTTFFLIQTFICFSQKVENCVSMASNIKTDAYFFTGAQLKYNSIWEVKTSPKKYKSAHSNIFSQNELNGLEKATKLERLSLAFSKLDSFPNQIKYLVNLKVLDLTGFTWHSNTILHDKIPSDIGALKELKIFILDCNKIDSLPKELGSLKKLKKLGLGNNLLKSIPSSLENLTNLEILDVSFNQIKEIPEWFYSLKNLKEVYLSGNEIQQKDLDRLKLKLPNAKIVF